MKELYKNSFAYLESTSEFLTNSNFLYFIRKRIPNPFLLILFLVLMLSFFISIYLTTQSEYSELGVNILVELGGIIFTIYVVDFFYKRFNNVRSVPTRSIIWKQIVDAFDRYFIMWHTLYKEADQNATGKICDFSDRETFIEMMKKIDLDKPVRKGNKITYGQLIQKMTIAIKNELIYTQRVHNRMMEPKFMVMINEFLESNFTGSLLELNKLNKLRGSIEPSLYSVSLKPDEEYFKNLMKIHNWLNKEKKRLSLLSYDNYLVTTLSSSYF